MTGQYRLGRVRFSEVTWLVYFLLTDISVSVSWWHARRVTAVKPASVPLLLIVACSSRRIELLIHFQVTKGKSCLVANTVW